VLKNAAHLKRAAAEALDALSEGEETLLDRLGTVKHSVQDLLRMDATLAEVAGLLDQADGALQDAARALSRYQDRLDVDPAELASVEERLDVLNRLIHKYAKAVPAGADALEAVLAYRAQIGQKAEQLKADAAALGGLEREIAKLARELARLGQRLSQARKQSAKRLKSLVEGQFRELEMNEAAFEVDIRTRAAGDPAVDSSGLDEMEFMVRTNPGQDMLPLRKIASGGEMSRIMLALKTILAGKDQVSVLVFDEIDANIGDRLGATIGRKMRALAHGRRVGRGEAADAGGHQIICITHLSQIAACADHHLHISKETVGPQAGRQTVAKVRVLAGDARIGELAEMMAGKGVTDATVAHARNLLKAAQADSRVPRVSAVC
jgi:DNA repair protein RecN (Recombination protein N)